MKLMGGIFFAALFVFALCMSSAESVMLTAADDIEATDNNEVQSGNGLLDFILFLEASGGGVSENAYDGFDGDDANNELPTGNTIDTANESFITSIGELRAFYLLNFDDIDQGNFEIRVFVDINQTGQSGLSLDVFEIVRNFDLFSTYTDRNDPFANDISPEHQNITNDAYSGGTVLAYLDVPAFLAHNQQGAGWADYTIFTGVNPFDPAFSDTDRILFHWESSQHNDGGETIFLSGGYMDERTIPEPSMIILSSLGLVAFGLKRKR